MGRLLRNLIKFMAMRYGMNFLFVKLCKPRGDEYAEWLKWHGKLHHLGKDCAINSNVVITDPDYVSIGNNVILASCALIGHDASIAMLGRVYNVKLDRAGKIDIKDNVFIGHGAIVLPGITIGPNAIVGAGAVVTKNVVEGDIVGGVPAKPIGKVRNLVSKLKTETEKLPWKDLIYKRENCLNSEIEKELIQKRVLHFFGEKVGVNDKRN